MKHLFRSVVVLGILAVPAVASAQGTAGLRLRLNLADYVDPVFAATQQSAEIAAFGTVPLNDVVAFQPEVLLKLEDPRFSGRTKFNYSQVPLLLRFGFAKGSPVAILAGPALGILTREERFADGIDIALKRLEVGAVAGAEVGSEHVVLDGRYTWGLSSIQRNGAPEVNHDGSVKRRVLSVSVGARF